MVHVEFYEYKHVILDKPRCSNGCQLYFNLTAYDNNNQIVGHDDTKDSPITHNNQETEYIIHPALIMDFPFNNYEVSCYKYS